jgi:hypothetical protein
MAQRIVRTASEGITDLHACRSGRGPRARGVTAIDGMPLPAPINGIVPLTFLHTERGKMRSKKPFGNDFAGWVKLADLPDQCRLHGLKKGGMRRGAEAGFTTHELMAKSGHKSRSEVRSGSWSLRRATGDFTSDRA